MNKSKILKFLDSSFAKGFFFKNILAPVWYLLELILYNRFWNKYILGELVTNDEVFNWLDRNEFEINQNRFTGSYFRTLKLVDDYELLVGKTNQERKQEIHKDFVLSFADILEKNCTFNVEEYLELIVEVDTRIFKYDKDQYRADVFDVYIRFYRYSYLQTAISNTVNWIITLVTFICLIMCVISIGRLL